MVSEAPASVWLRPRTVRDPDGPVLPGQGWYQTLLHDEPSAVRYVRADVYEALVLRHTKLLAQQEPLGELGADYTR
jgi:hypothetical protein